MDCKNNNVDQLSFENWNSEQFSQLDKEIEDVKSKLFECQEQYKYAEINIFNLNRLKHKGTYILENIERRYNDLDEDLKEIHCNFIKYITKVYSTDEMINQKINSLTLQKDNLKRELAELRKVADEYDKRLIEIKKIITIQEKKNTALARKLKKTIENMYITPDLKKRVNMILLEPKVTNKI